jgi:hypothetical protein
MAYYLVRSRVREELSHELLDKIRTGAFMDLQPFGKSLTKSLRNARVDEDGFWIWEEEDYCSPPLRQEREAVFDRYFHTLHIQKVEHGEGWEQIQQLPRVLST